MPVLTAILGLAVALLALSLWRVYLALRRQQEAASRIAHGDLAQRLPPDGPSPIRALSDSLNQMADLLQQRLQTATQQRNELEAVLASMIEGVLAIDKQQRVFKLNLAAAAMLGVDPVKSAGRHINEVVRNSALLQFVGRTLASQSPMQCDIVLAQPAEGNDSAAAGDRFIELQGAALRDAAGRWIGVLVVLHDVTRLRRLETLRRDFVANVSHEIKTPVAAIKAAAEILADCQSDAADPDAARLVSMIQRHAERLHALVEDILELARIEEAGERQRVVTEVAPLLEPLQNLVRDCAPQAQARNISLHLSCPPELCARFNPPLLDHALLNLLDNAIKYGKADSQVAIEVRAQDDEVVIAIRDQGPGIAPEHLDRIFERFYRPDRGRHRAAGGTGLGLAIVKHSAQAQGGRADVASVLGEGSTFRLYLPAR